MPLADLWPAWRAEWVLHEDEDLIVVDKPAWIPTHPPEPGRVDDAHTRVSEWLRARDGGSPYLGIHQRLDAETSGVLLFTRRKSANPAVAEQFERRRIDKTYVAGVCGLPARPDRGELRHRLVAGRDGAMRALPPGGKGGQEAVTRWHIVRRSGDRTLVELSPETGRTHQLRVQLAARSAPIAGDTRYGGPPARRLMLHATSLALRRPATGRPTTYRAPIPAAFETWLAGEATSLRDTDAIERALREAADRRYGVSRLANTDAFRLANGAGDGLPGVSVDRYGQHLVVSISGEEAEAAQDRVLDAAARLGGAGVYLKVRPKHASRIVDSRRDEFAPRAAVRGDDAPEAFTVHELGLPFEVHLGDGLSTGIFLDQRENRRRVRELAAGARVLNLFGYTGAFSVAAAAGGARSTVTVDVSRGALAWAGRNLAAAGVDPEKHALAEADALVWLKHAASTTARYDLVLLDPPSFATTKTSRFSAESDYRAIATLALRVLAPRGKLLACTNHRGIVRAKLRRYLHEAAREADRRVVQMKDLPDPVDFPAEPGHEAHLKSILVSVA